MNPDDGLSHACDSKRWRATTRQMKISLHKFGQRKPYGEGGSLISPVGEPQCVRSCPEITSGFCGRMLLPILTREEQSDATETRSPV